MSTTPDQTGGARWAEWFLKQRHGGSEALRQMIQASLAPIRDKVLDNARVSQGDTVLDVGAGDGLVAFGAIERVGDAGQVIFSDITADLLERNRQTAEELGVAGRCQFTIAAAEDLAAIADGSVDVVTVRAVLLTVVDKQRAFESFFRVLRPGGRLSISEPINSWLYADPRQLWGFDISPIQTVADKIRTHFVPPAGNPMTGFDERDLLTYAAEAGFAERHLELRVDIEPQQPRSWASFVETAYSPAAPTIASVMAAALTVAEQALFETHLRPLVEQGAGGFPRATAYVWAAKPREMSDRAREVGGDSGSE